MIVSLDAEAFNALAGPDSPFVTGDEDDLLRLSGPYHNVVVERV